MLNSIFSFFHGIRPVDIIDIGIISFFIYLLLVWFKRARVRFTLVGMAIIGVVYVVARVFGLYLTTMVFQAFFAIFLIVIVIIFQDDFRHFFERVAVWGTSYKKHVDISERGPFIDMLCSGIANLSRKKVGALIAIKGRDPLERYLEAGVKINGELSQILLEAIFEPNAPSHDGAVIVDGSRILTFGSYLPLSTNVQEVGRLGTRHAAALGLVEKTDAMCVIVSEERGTISVAEMGRIKQLGDATRLKHALEEFFNKRFPQRKKGPFIDFLTGHFIEKIVAVILAATLWVSFGHRTDVIRRDFVVPIEYRNLASDTIINEPKPKDITVTLSGSERTFNLMDPKELKVSLDMAQVKQGENRITLTKDLIKNPSALSVVNVEPNEIELNVYKMVTINVPVQVKTFGRAANGIKINDIKAVPVEVSVVAPSNIPQQSIYVMTEDIDLSSITETATLSPKLILSPGARFAGDKAPDVRVVIEVEKKE